jgi:hypothetical protein
MHTSGACGLGWALGATIGGALAAEEYKLGFDFTCCVLGDGSFLFSGPSAAYWVARRCVLSLPLPTHLLHSAATARPFSVRHRTKLHRL